MNPDTLNIAVLVFREGLETVLVLAAVTASLSGSKARFRRPITAGVGAGMLATAVTWLIAVRIIDALGDSVSALHLQAATGLLAVVVLLVVMNWFFHRTYWTGWITLHTNRRRALVPDRVESVPNSARLWLGLALLGFSSLYREGFEVVLFLQSYRLRLGATPVTRGAFIGSAGAIVVALLTFVAHRRLPYRKMLIATGIMLGFVLFVMVGEQAQEMQLAHWLPTTVLPSLVPWFPDWAGLWFSLFPTVETLVAQALAVSLVLVSYRIAGHRSSKQNRAA